MFELEHAIRQWRTDLSNLQSMPPEDISELEAHLRESTESLETGGLTPEEAWLIARRRLGGSKILAQEFGVEDPGGFWAPRVHWAVCGVLASIIWNGVAYAAGWCEASSAAFVYSQGWTRAVLLLLPGVFAFAMIVPGVALFAAHNRPIVPMAVMGPLAIVSVAFEEWVFPHLKLSVANPERVTQAQLFFGASLNQSGYFFVTCCAVASLLVSIATRVGSRAPAEQ